ncbi:AAA family ATPase [Flammeovirga sp. MY04]|uniref:AAA family ATPase n=1 Tax=Flammeovirga sp. MY04 TaxID=1191459 RepID=UPI00080641D8|nr:AAA family ATPase [Flammeovirga sp. MY04]ANQ51576.1 AAA family ATPase [Flammeovirga sp. MY04]
MNENKFDSSQHYVSLKNLLLDPNNYRFIDNKKYKKVEPEKIRDENIQKRTLNFIIGDKRKNIDDLLVSLKSNGFLKVDTIQVERLDSNKFRVLEGNRRIATLKVLQEDYNVGIDIGNLDPSIFSKVPVVIYEEKSSGEHEIIMGLKHISGNKRWAPLNQAQLIYDLFYDKNLTEHEIHNSLGITIHSVRRNIRTLSLIQEYKKSDFQDQFKPDMFAIFREAISSTSIKDWLKWDDFSKKAIDARNLERFFSWISESANYQVITNEFGEEEEEENLLPPAITKSTEIPTLAKIINDEQAIWELEKTRSINDAYSVSATINEDQYQKSIDTCESSIEDMIFFSKKASNLQSSKLTFLKKKFDNFLSNIGVDQNVSSSKSIKNIFVNYKSEKFSELTLHDFKGFKTNIKFHGLNKINLFAGDNNSGKSSILEAIYLLTIQNDINDIIEIYRRRGKYLKGLPKDWFSKYFNQISISGRFDNKDVILKISSIFEDFDDKSKTDYINTLFVEHGFGENILNSEASEEIYYNKTESSSVKFFKNNKEDQFFREINTICNISYSSPFTLLNKDFINTCHEESVKKGTYKKIISFIQNSIDSNISDIIKVGSGEQVRFLVDHERFKEPVDITTFGDGLQRIFYIGLQASIAVHGVMCIDELENAIHHSLLQSFTKFLQEISSEFDIQFFITTHSNECIKAFFENGYNNDEISGYKLLNKNGEITYKGAKGKSFEKQVMNFGLDIRGKGNE